MKVIQIIQQSQNTSKKTDEQIIDESLTLEQKADKIINDIEIIELNRVKREKLTQREKEEREKKKK